MAMASAIAGRALAGREPRPPDAWVDEIRSVTGPEVRDTFEEFHSSLLFGVPGEAIWDHPLPLLRPRGTPTIVRGRRWRSVNWPADATRLVIGDEGVELRAGKDERTVPVSSVVGMLAFEDGLRHVIQADGFGLWVDPLDWHSGPRAVERLDRVIPAELHLPRPAATRPGPHRVGVVRRWTSPVTRRLSRPSLATWLAVLVFFVGAAVAVGSVMYGYVAGLPVSILVTGAMLRILADRIDP
jgi:hypothetical protein